MAKTLGNEFSNDVNVASGLVLSLMFDPKGVQGITQAIQKTDPVQGMASVLSVLLTNVRQKTEDLDIDPRVWSAKGGVIDRVIEESKGLASSVGVEGADSPEFGQAVKQELMSQLSGKGAEPEQGGLLAAPMASQQPPDSMPMGGMPV